MNNQNNLIWKVIGNKKFCCFKKFSSGQNFCKNMLNVTGLCVKQSCPLSNEVYATIIEKNGLFFLYMKDSNNSNFPNLIWKKVLLSRNFIKAIQQIDFNLALWPKFFVNKSKLRMTKLNQIAIRSKLKNIKNESMINSCYKTGPIDTRKRYELPAAINIEKKIESELLIRLHMGIYGDNYLLNPINQWKKLKESKIKLRKIEFEPSSRISIRQHN